MTGRGRPAVGPRVEVRLEPELKAELEAIADYSGWTLAGLIRDILYKWVATGDDSAYEDAAARSRP